MLIKGVACFSLLHINQDCAICFSIPGEGLLVSFTISVVHKDTFQIDTVHKLTVIGSILWDCFYIMLTAEAIIFC